MRRRAYTLVEVLAVTVLIGLLAGLGAPPLLRAISGDPLERAAGRLAQAFRDARSQGYGRQLGLTLESWGFSVDDGSRAGLPTVRLPETVLVAWSRDRRPLRTLEFDARGHGLDTEVTLRLDERTVAYTIDGLTGRWLPRPQP